MFIEGLRTEFSHGPVAWMQPVSLPLLAVAAYVFLAPNVDFVPHLTWNDGQRIAQLVLMGIVVLGLAAPGVGNAVAGEWGALPCWSRIALFTAFALGFTSAMYAHLWRWAMLEWAMLLLLLVVAMGVAAGRRAGGAHLDRLLVMVLFATATAYVTKSVVVYFAMLTVGAEYGMGFNVRELYTGFSNIRFFGHVQTMLLPFLLLPAMWWGTTRARRVMLWSVPAVWWVLAVGSGTRGTWVALLVGIVAVAIYGGRDGRQWIKWQCGGLLCGLLCYAVFILAIPWLLEQPVSFLHRAEDIMSLSRREILWATSIAFATQYPLFGIGPMHYAYFATEVAAHPHNAVLQWLAEWGIPATLLLTSVCVAAGLSFAAQVRRTADQGTERVRLIRVALLAALAGAAAQAMVDGVLVMPVSQTLLTLLCGWAIGIHFTGRPARAGVAQNTILIAFTVVAAGAVVYGVAPEIGRIAEREQAYLANHPPNTPLLPRFWAQGWINE